MRVAPTPTKLINSPPLREHAVLSGIAQIGRLESFYGQTPHRISHREALSLNGIPVLSGLTASSSSRKSSASAAKHGIQHRYESPATLTVSSKRLGDRTWISSLERAVLEYAQHVPDIDSDEIIQRCLIFSNSKTFYEVLSELSSKMKWQDGIRRLASVSEQLAERSGFCNIVSLENSPSAQHGDHWINLNQREAAIAGSTTEWKDMKYKVCWQTHPDRLYEHLMY